MAATWVASAVILIAGVGYGPETGIKVNSSSGLDVYLPYGRGPSVHKVPVYVEAGVRYTVR